jgi:hypothetical protein
MLTSLTLSPGPYLTYRMDSGGEEDVLLRAAEFLFEPVYLEEGVVLADLLGLFKAAPTLMEVFNLSYARELIDCVEDLLSARKPAQYHPEGIEYLEVYRKWALNSDTRELSVSPPTFYGVGFALQSPQEVAGCLYPEGARVEWGLSLSNPRELLHLPIRVKEEVTLAESDFDAKAYGKTILEFKAPNGSMPLHELIQGVLGELTFHGSCTEIQEAVSLLKKEYDKLRESSDDKTYPSYDLFSELYGESLKALFETTSGSSAGKIYRRLREVEDDEPVQKGLSRIWTEYGEPNPPRVRAEYQALAGRPFRKLFRKIKKGNCA